MSKVIEGAEVHGSMFEVWRYWWVTAVGAKRSFMRKQDDGAPATARHGDGRVQANVARRHSSRKLYGDKKALLRLDNGQIRKELANQAKAPNNSIDIVQNKTKDVGKD